ncbi:hypothetical protein BL253_20520 [Pseudofrankia asymbiotica]|uniref:Dihydrolipoamide acetyltransferase component of pyruvate dehydrogenase complex n=2 Tax=Pseudofrankia asymbiotica TaxID=1834516 RepID=A0A1V2I7R0_9ACTN|nr:hypothetical protein BL253_20520 [Pseudofrankia asymbiotica]
MPQWGMAMKEGAVNRWHKAVGDKVALDDVLAEIEAAKTNGELVAPVDGVLASILVPEGEVAQVQQVLAVIALAGEDPAEVSGARPDGPVPTVVTGTGGPRPAGGKAAPVVPAARKLAKEHGLDPAAVAGTGPGGRVLVDDVRRALAERERAAAAPAPSSAPSAPTREAGADRPMPASPVARRTAERLGVDLDRVVGTGPGGRVTKEDVEQAAASASASNGSGAVAVAPVGRPPAVAGQRAPMSGMRRIIAARMRDSLRDSAQLTLGRRVDMTAAVALRTALVADWAALGAKPSYTDLVVVAAARALREHPGLNAVLHPETQEVELLGPVDVGLAVALDDGLVVPAIRAADTRTLFEVAGESQRLAEAARAGTLGPDDLTGSTFTVTALGSAGVEWFTPVLNPPEVAILGVGALTDEVAWDGDTPMRRRAMTLSLTIDHQVVDGAPGAAFLATVADLLAHPHRLLR